MGLRERRSQQWCRTEDVRTIKEGDVNTDRWRIETPLGISKQECNEDKLETRVTKLEEQTKWMYDRMTAAAAESSTWNRGIPWRYEDNGDEWQRWEGSWWIRVNQDDLNSRQRRKISRNLRKMIDREKNGMARLLQELKKGIRAEVESRRGADTNSEDNERSRDDDDENCTTYQVRIPLYSDVPALCSHMHFFRYPQHSMNHREQFSLSVVTTSETIFRLCVLCCPLSVGVVPQRRFPIRFYQHDSLRFRCLHML